MQTENHMSAETEAQKSARMEEIQRFSDVIKEKRKNAIEGRRASGIEDVWEMCEDAYEGRDKYNRKKSTYTKSRNADGGLQEEKKAPAGRSTIIPNITRPYCDAASARVADMLLPTDDRNWAIRPTPDPKLIRNKDNPTPAKDVNGQPIMKPAPQQPSGVMARMGNAITGAFSPQAQQPVSVGELAQQAIDKAKTSADRAQEVIDDWMVEGRFHAASRRVIESTAKMGTGILKGPFPAKKRARAVLNSPEGWKVVMEVKTAPLSASVSPWNFYPDPNCGDDIQKGAYCLERDDITAKGLRELKGPGYINEMIDMCLEEGPVGSTDGVRKLKENTKVSDKDLYEIWYWHGEATKQEMAAAGCECERDLSPVIVTMVNERVIKITQAALDSGEFPYDVMVWQERDGSWAGIGVAEQINPCQVGLTGGVRALQDNMAISSGPQIIVDSSKIEPANGKWEVVPNKMWRKKVSSEDINDVRNAFTIVSIETRQVEILNIINFWIKEAEDVTGLPMLLQGQQGNAPNTLGGTQIVNNNSSTVLRRIARTYDDRVTELHIGRYYEWLLLHGPDDAKGDMQIDARGSSALVERDIQNQAMIQLLGASLNPAYELDPVKTMQEVMKGMRLDNKNFALDEEQKKTKAQQKPPEDPRIVAAKITADSKVKVEEMETKQLADHAVAQAHLDTAKQAHEAREADKDRALEQMAMEIESQLASSKLSSEERRALEVQKVLLASLTLKLNVTKDLAVADAAVNLHKNKQVMSPVVEPLGRAQNGKSFQQ